MAVSINIDGHVLTMKKSPLGLTVELDGNQIGKTGGTTNSELTCKIHDGREIQVSAVWKSVFPTYKVVLDGTVIYNK